MKAEKTKSPLLIVITTVLVFLALLIGAASALYAGARLAGEITLESAAADALEDKTGELHYKDVEYTYKEGLCSIALLAVDGDELIAAALVALPENEDDPISVVTVPADAEAALMVLDEYGAAVDLELAPLSAAYEKEDGALITRDALSDMFHGVPVCGWVCLPLDKLSPALSDAQDGFEVTLAANENGYGDVGDTVTLKGADALYLLRQNEGEWPAVLSGYLASIGEASEENPIPPVLSAKVLYDESETDLTLPQTVYLASQLLRGRAAQQYELPLNGETEGGRGLLDVVELYDLTIRIFFDK